MGQHHIPLRSIPPRSASSRHVRTATGLALSASLALLSTPAFAQTTDSPAAPSATTSSATSPLVAAADAGTPPNAPAGARLERQVLKEGDKGEDVKSLQRDLTALGYWCGDVDGHFGLATSQAVMALQKVAGISRDAQFGPATAKALAAKSRPAAKSRKGTVVEINKALQVILVVKNGAVQTIINTSTGNDKPYDENGSKGVANTPTGTFKIFRQEVGWHKAKLGELYYPKYFTGGYAIHGSLSIPAYPASHGCARVSVPAMDMLWKQDILPMGRTVMVYEK